MNVHSMFPRERGPDSTCDYKRPDHLEVIRLLFRSVAQTEERNTERMEQYRRAHAELMEPEGRRMPEPSTLRPREVISFSFQPPPIAQNAQACHKKPVALEE